MKLLSITDQLFSWLDNKNQPMHVAGLCFFELPDPCPKNFFLTLIEQLNSNQNAPVFPFNQVLWQHIFWKRADNFSINHHFFHIKFTHASTEQVLDYVCIQHSRPLDKRRPLWEFHLLEGIAPEHTAAAPARFAIYLKLHHTLADGISAMRLLRRSLSPSPIQMIATPIWAWPAAANQPNHNPKHPWQNTIGKDIAAISQALVKRYRDRKLPTFSSSLAAPKSLLNTRISPKRRLAFRSFAKQRFTAIAQHLQSTTNDVILAVCSGALRRYLLSKNALPQKPLIGFIPISLRPNQAKINAAQDAMGNQLAFLATNLASNNADRLERLAIITQSTKDGKQRFAQLSPAQIVAYSLMVYGLFGLNLATGLYPQKQAFNLIISNIPANTQEPLYLNGARLTHIYPASVLFAGQALNISFCNRQNSIDFGITACQKTLGDIDALLNYFSDELRAYESDIASSNDLGQDQENAEEKTSEKI